jgi:hypothetical protein
MLSTNCENNILLLLQNAIVINDINLIKAIILSGKMPKYEPAAYASCHPFYVNYRGIFNALITTSTRESFSILRERLELSIVKNNMNLHLVTHAKLRLEGPPYENKVPDIIMAVIKHDRDDIMQYIWENNDLTMQPEFLKYMLIACMKRARNIIKLLINNKDFSCNMLPRLLQYNIPELTKLAFDQINF